MTRAAYRCCLVLMGLALAFQASSQEADPLQLETPTLYEEVLVTGGADAIRTLSGSASFIDEESIRSFDATDLNALLGQVPGVYIRFEDGYGLRPNIGIRGATTERSQKITLMEDGMLIAPAPYSAPAAYYIPNVNRMTAVEVFKGPAAIAYGPHTVGGAVNLVTPALPQEAGGELDVSVGSDEFEKVRVVYGATSGQFAWSIDGLHYGADGFKSLDSGGDTGFERNDLNLRLGWSSPTDAALSQRVELKLGYADEDSDETYLGLTDADFGQDEDRRYIGSERDRFESEHYQAHLLHNLALDNGTSLFTTAYVNRFDRSWDKFDGFIDGPPPNLVLAYPDIFIEEMALLRGEIDSTPGDDSTILDLTNNDREYGSHGIESRLNFSVPFAGLDHELRIGARFHHDYVERDHKIRGYLVESVGLVADGEGRRGKKALNKAETDAWSVFASNEFEIDAFKFNLGLRYESMDGEFDDRLNGRDSKNFESIVMPGGGVFYQWSETVGFLAGINKGFSPAGPSAADGVDPEESINYEYGVRYSKGDLNADLIGFFSDYSNLLGRCRASDSGCEVGDEFNGGKVEISGAELTGNWVGQFGRGWLLPVQLTYTYTESSFQETFQSGFSQWGLVEKGDELPYTPEHQGRLQVGLQRNLWDVNLALQYIGKMRERPGQGGYEDGAYTRALTTWDFSASYELVPELTLRFIAQNLTDEREIVSRRPFGARPNMPRSYRVGVSYRF